MKNLRMIIKTLLHLCLLTYKFFTTKRQILFYGYFPMNYTMFKSLHKKIEELSNTEVFFRLSPENDYDEYVRLGVPVDKILAHKDADTRIWDAVIGADVNKPWIRWKTKFIQIYHGVAAKKYYIADAITGDYRYHPELKEFDIVFFINETDYYNAKNLNVLKSEQSGEIVGMCCLDQMILNSNPQNISKLKDKYVPSQYHDKRIILYAPTWDETASFQNMGQEILAALSQLDAFIIIKPHPKCITSEVGITGYDLRVYLSNFFTSDKYLLVTDTPYEIMPISDIIISDFGSIAFEYSLLRRPVLLFEGLDYAKKIADMEQYNLLKECCYVYNDVNSLKYFINNNCEICNHIKSSMEILQNKYFSNVGNATNIAINKLLERKVIFKNKHRRNIQSTSLWLQS